MTIHLSCLVSCGCPPNRGGGAGWNWANAIATIDTQAQMALFLHGRVRETIKDWADWLSGDAMGSFFIATSIRKSIGEMVDQ
jgi:hypothetical protein